ncbi:NAD(P)H-dependent oxidoreductase subunit E, partial [Vibrio parahaemolyticus]
MLSEQTKARFDRELAKYPADQRISAVMACLSIIQQERGWVSPESEQEVADHIGVAPMAVHEV